MKNPVIEKFLLSKKVEKTDLVLKNDDKDFTHVRFFYHDGHNAVVSKKLAFTVFESDFKFSKRVEYIKK
jgi:hypothetical protein